MKKKVIVACGGAVATSTIAANKVVELCKKNNIDVEICQVRISEIESNLPADLIVPTSKVKRDFGVPQPIQYAPLLPVQKHVPRH